LIDAAERLACFALLTGLETMAVEEHAGTLSTNQLANLPPGVTIRSIEGGVHDLSLSDPDAQTRVFSAVSAWLQTLR
jgi:hypothetical protein